jgi:hypothetical protein
VDLPRLRARNHPHRKDSTMNDITALDIHFRGYPVTVVSDGAWKELWLEGSNCAGQKLRTLLHNAVDTAGPDEPSGWLFSSSLGTADGTEVWIERFGGMRDFSTNRHEGGMWSVYLPAER